MIPSNIHYSSGEWRFTFKNTFWRNPGNIVSVIFCFGTWPQDLFTSITFLCEMKAVLSCPLTLSSSKAKKSRSHESRVVFMRENRPLCSMLRWWPLSRKYIYVRGFRSPFENRSRNPSGSVGSHDFEDCSMSMSSRSSPLHEHSFDGTEHHWFMSLFFHCAEYKFGQLWAKTRLQRTVVLWFGDFKCQMTHNVGVCVCLTDWLVVSVVCVSHNWVLDQILETNTHTHTHTHTQIRAKSEGSVRRFVQKQKPDFL